jgi:AraC-like DNA-binding protein
MKWSEPDGQLYYPAMPRPKKTTRLTVSLFATPSPLHEELFYTVVRAGHLVGGADHHIQRDHYPGHEIILCLRGTGFATIGGRRHPVRAGQLVWVNCHRPHEHGAIPGDPWELYWIRIGGPRLDRIGEALGVAEAPVFVGFDSSAAGLLFQEIFALMQDRPANTPALVHASIARLIALAFSCRQRQTPAEPQSPAVLHRAIEQMKLFYFQKHRVADLAGLCGVSESHFTRIFRAAFGTTPIDWLRRERISQAKRRLVETSDAIKEIAAQVGYSDHYFFSKDFKQLTGLPPSQYRQREASGSRDPD